MGLTFTSGPFVLLFQSIYAGGKCQYADSIIAKNGSVGGQHGILSVIVATSPTHPSESVA